jgi:GH15 family glucan-1,4-alpha-glucosidase
MTVRTRRSAKSSTDGLRGMYMRSNPQNGLVDASLFGYGFFGVVSESEPIAGSG